MLDFVKFKKYKFLIIGLFISVAFLVFNFSGLRDNQLNKQDDSVEELKSEGVLDAISDSAENIEDMVSPIEVQAEESMEIKENLPSEESADENILPEEESPIVVKSKWAWPLVDLSKPKTKIKNNELKIGFITDTHVLSTQYSGGVIRAEDIFRERMEYFIKQMNNKFVPNFILIKGDVIEGTKRPAEIGMEELSQCKDIFNQTAIKKYWTVGNHDLRSVTKKQWRESLGINYTNTTFEIGDYKIIIVDGNFYSNGLDVAPGKGFTPGMLSVGQKEWLKSELESSDKKKVIFIHQPLLASDKNTLRGASEIRTMLSQNNAKAVFSGHSEALFHGNLDGVDYFTIPGMTKNSFYPANFAEIVVNDSGVSTKIYYKSGEGKIYRTRLIK